MYIDSENDISFKQFPLIYTIQTHLHVIRFLRCRCYMRAPNCIGQIRWRVLKTFALPSFGGVEIYLKEITLSVEY